MILMIHHPIEGHHPVKNRFLSHGGYSQMIPVDFRFVVRKSKVTWGKFHDFRSPNDFLHKWNEDLSNMLNDVYPLSISFYGVPSLSPSMTVSKSFAKGWAIGVCLKIVYP